MVLLKTLCDVSVWLNFPLCSAGGRDAAGLLPLLQCLGKFLVDPRYSRLLLGVAHRVLDAYAGEVTASSLPVPQSCASLLCLIACASY